MPQANSCVSVLPTTIAPACLARRTAYASALRDVALEDARPVGRRDALGVVEILDREREALQRAGGAVLVGLLGALGRLAGAVSSVSVDERAQLGVLGGGIDHFDGGQFARGERRSQLDGGLHAQEVKQQRADALGGVELHPVARAVDALVAPGAVDELAGALRCRPRAGSDRRCSRHRGCRRSTFGSGRAGASSRAGCMFARYQFELAVSAPGRSRRSIAASSSGWLAIHSRSSAQSFWRRISSASGNWNSSMYQDFSRWATVRWPEAGCPTDSTASWSTRAGCISANAHATPAPQSCPTTRACSMLQLVEDLGQVGDALADAVGLDLGGLVGLPEAAQVRCDDPETRVR